MQAAAAYHDKGESMLCVHHFPLDLGLPLLKVSCANGGGGGIPHET